MTTIQDLVAQATGWPRASFSLALRPALSYQSNRLYDLRNEDRRFIVKEFLQAGELADAPAREHRALTLLAPLDIAPQPLFYDPALGPVVIYEYMDGEMWDRRRPEAHELAELSAVWLRMSALPADGLWYSRGQERSLQDTALNILKQLQAYAAWTASHFPEAAPAAEHIIELAKRRECVLSELLDLEPALCFCRSDPRFANVIARPDGRLGLVDWEDSGLRDPARDLADIITHPNQEDLLTWREWQAFLQPYLDRRSAQDKTLARRMHLYLAIFPMFWLSIILGKGMQLQAEGGDHDDWRVNDLPANDRLRRYLARAAAWPEIGTEEEHLDEFAGLRFFPES